MILEPVLGEGGYVPAPAPFVRGVADLCREHGILFVADEVQTGFGRTGRMFAVEHYGVQPDVICMAKGIASGFPFAALGASAELMARWPTGSHGGTYGGNPIGCAAALATIEVLTEPGFLDNVRARGEQLMAGLSELQAEDEGIAAGAGPRPDGGHRVGRRQPCRRDPAPLPRGGEGHRHERRHLRAHPAVDAAARGHRDGDRSGAGRLWRGAEGHLLTWLASAPTRNASPSGAPSSRPTPRINRVLEQELEEQRGLPLHWYDVLVQLHEAGGRLRMQELADRVLLHTSSISRLVDRMEAAGLVTRAACPSDGRSR